MCSMTVSGPLTDAGSSRERMRKKMKRYSVKSIATTACLLLGDIGAFFVYSCPAREMTKYKFVTWVCYLHVELVICRCQI